MTSEELQIALDVILMKGCKCLIGRAAIVEWLKEQKDIDSWVFLQALTVLVPPKLDNLESLFSLLGYKKTDRRTAAAFIERMYISQETPPVRMASWPASVDVELRLRVDHHELDALYHIIRSENGIIEISPSAPYALANGWDHFECDFGGTILIATRGKED